MCIRDSVKVQGPRCHLADVSFLRSIRGARPDVRHSVTGLDRRANFTMDMRPPAIGTYAARTEREIGPWPHSGAGPVHIGTRSHGAQRRLRVKNSVIISVRGEGGARIPDCPSRARTPSAIRTVGSGVG